MLVYVNQLACVKGQTSAMKNMERQAAIWGF